MNKQDDNLLGGLDWDMEPSRDLWPEISAKLQHSNSFEKNDYIEQTPSVNNIRSHPSWMPVAMAACLMIAIGSLSLSYYSMNRNSEYMELQAAVLMQHQETIRAIEAQHEEVKTNLVALLNNENGALNPTLVAEAHSILNTTDAASEHIKRAIENSPDKQAYLKMLVETYQRETDLLKRIKLSQELSI